MGAANQTEVGVVVPAIGAAGLSESRLRALVDSLPGAVFEYHEGVNGTHRLDFLGQGAEHMLGVRAEDAMQDATLVFDRVVPEDRPGLDASITAAGGSMLPWRHLARIRRGDGVVRWIEASAAPRADADGSTRWTGVMLDVTEQREAQAERARLSGDLEALLESVDAIVWEYDPEVERFLWVSGSAERLLGHPLCAWTEVPEFWHHHIHPDDRERAVSYCVAETLAGRDHAFEYRFQHADGRWRWLHDRVRVRQEPTGVRLFGVMLDVTAAREADAARRSAELRARYAMEGTGDGLWDWEVGTDHVWMSRQLKQMMGYTEGELTDTFTTWSDHVHPDDLPLAMRDIEAHLRGETELYENRHRLQRRDGSWFWTLAKGRVIEWHDDGRPKRMIGTQTDIDLAVRAADDAESLARRLGLAVDAGRYGVWDHDLRTDRGTWDARTREIYGLDPDAAVGGLDWYFSLIHPDDRGAMRTALDAVVASPGVSYRFEARHRRGDDWRVVGGTVIAEADHAGRPVRLVGLERDITIERRAQQQAESLETQLRESQKLETLGTLAGGVAHDFNNLLASINGSIELASATVDDPSQVLEHLSHAQVAGDRARDLVRRLLQFARRAPTGERRPLDLRHAVEQTAVLLAPSVTARIHVTVRSDARDHVVLADASAMQQVLLNLCTNAAQAIGDREGNITLAVQTHTIAAGATELPVGAAPGTWVGVAVEDDGPGIPDEVRARLFEPFFTTKPPGEGTGLGLSIVHGIVVEHGGWITVSSEPGKGTTVQVMLPPAPSPSAAQWDASGGAATGLGVPAGTAPRSARPTVGDPPSPAAPSGAEILIVDDEPLVARVCAHALRRLGYTPRTCTTVREGWDALTESPDRWRVLLIDRTMPGQTGPEFIQRAREAGHRLPVVLMSGDLFSLPPGLRDELGPMQTLAKPFTLSELGDAMAEALRGVTIAP